MALTLTGYAKSLIPLIDTPKTYKLVWADEFNKSGPPDAANWKFEQALYVITNCSGINRKMPGVAMACLSLKPVKNICQTSIIALWVLTVKRTGSLKNTLPQV